MTTYDSCAADHVKDSPGLLPPFLCILQAIKKWRSKRHGNEAMSCRVNTERCHLFNHVRACVMLKCTQPNALFCCISFSHNYFANRWIALLWTLSHTLDWEFHRYACSLPSSSFYRLGKQGRMVLWQHNHPTVLIQHCMQV